MHKSNVLQKLRAGQPVLTSKLNSMNPQFTEMMGMMGFDCMWLGNEHLFADESTVAHLILACRAAGMDCMIRRNMSGYEDLLRPLEMGVNGFMIPRIRELDYIKKVVEYTKFPPIGRRGLDGVNADADFGLIPLEKYLERANRETFIVAQIEDPEALDIVDDIAAVEGVDVLLVGHGDLSLALGIPGKLRDPRILKAIDRVAEACAKHGKVPGIPVADTEDASRLMEKGYKFICCGGDYRFVKNGLLKTKEEFQALGFTFRDFHHEL